MTDGFGPSFYSSLSRDLTSGVIKSVNVSVASELEWIKFRLQPHIADLKKFRLNASHLSDAFWAYDWELAEATMAEMWQTSGPSLWLLSAEIAFRQEFKGLEVQKSFLSKIKERYPGGLPTYLAFHFSIRNEQRSTYRLFRDDYIDKLNSSKLNDDIRAYVEYKVLGDLTLSPDAISSILRIEQGQSIFDLYETVVDLLQQSLRGIAKPDWHDAANDLISALADVNDPRLTKIAIAFTGSATDDEIAAISGEYAERPRTIGTDPWSVFWPLVDGTMSPSDVLEIASSKSEATMTELLNSVLLRDEHFEESRSRIQKFSKNFHFLPGAKSLGVLNDFVTGAIPNSLMALGVACLNSKMLCLGDLTCRPEMGAQANPIFAKKFDPVDISDWTSSHEPSQSYQHRPLPWYLYALRLRDKDAEAAYDLLDELPEDHLSKQQKILFATLRIQTALESGYWREATKLIAQQISEIPDAVGIMPVADAFVGKDWDALNTISEKLDLSLALFAYWKQTDDSLHATYLRFSFEEVLYQLNVQLPARIPVELVKGDKRVQFFLEHVCVPPLMDTSGFFESSSELLDERLAILDLLTQAEAGNKERNETEAAAIAASKLIRSGLEVVDSNRVTVDSNALTRWANRKFRESYFRYQALRGAGVGNDARFDDIMEQVKLATDMSGEFFTVPTSEADTLLVEIILGLMRQFLEDQQYGLEYFLGKRIRHGTVAGHMRGPAEAARLITERRSPNSPYEVNTRWLENMNFADQQKREQASLAFSVFSEEYDKLIAEVRDRYLHVRSKGHPDGLFDIVLTAPQFHVLKSIAKPDVEFDHFVSICFQTFWALLVPSLTKARNFLSISAKAQVVRLYGELQNELSRAVESEEDSRNMSAAIQAVSTQVQRELDVVANWFERVESRTAHKFELKLALEISVQSALKSLTTFRPNIDWDIQGDISTTSSVLLVIWEFVFVVLDNIYRRAKVGNEPNIKLQCILDTERSRIRLKISNPLGDNFDIDSTERKLETTRAKISAGDIIGGAAADRGSGLLKIASITREYHNAEFEFHIEDRSFVTVMELPVFITADAFTLKLPDVE